MGTLHISDSALVVGIDETGCEDYKDKNHPVFGLGGCAVLAKDYFRYLDGPWKDIKEKYFGGSNIQLHATDIKKPNKDQLKSLEDFFTKLPFFRFASMSAEGFENKTKETNIHLLSHSVMNQICEFASRVQPTEIVYIIEESSRIEKDLIKHFGTYLYSNSDIKFQASVLTAAKDKCVSCVEVADFVVHPAGAQVRNRLMGYKNSMNIVRKDFATVFHEIDSRFCSYTEILSAKKTNA